MAHDTLGILGIPIDAVLLRVEVYGADGRLLRLGLAVVVKASGKLRIAID
jgi:hypothetical protein